MPSFEQRLLVSLEHHPVNVLRYSVHPPGDRFLRSHRLAVFAARSLLYQRFEVGERGSTTSRKDHYGLLRFGLDRYAFHARLLHGGPDCPCVRQHHSCYPHERLHPLAGQQLDFVAQALELTCPVLRAPTRFHADQAEARLAKCSRILSRVGARRRGTDLACCLHAPPPLPHDSELVPAILDAKSVR